MLTHYLLYLSFQQPRLRGLASADYSEDHLELEMFDTSEDFDSIDGHDEVYSFYESEDEDDYEEDSFATSAFRPVRPLVRKCFRWHDSAACRGGGRAGYCARGWIPKCIYCKRGAEADKKTGECVSSGGTDEKVERCFRWNDDAGCRRGSRSGHCIRGWNKKCIMCSQDEKVNKLTGECERNELFTKEA